MDCLIFTQLYKLTAYYALDLSRPTYDYDGVGNGIAYDDYAVNGRRNEGHNREGYYDDGADVYASWRLG